MAQKRCYGQQFRLRPDLLVRQIILYVLMPELDDRELRRKIRAEVKRQQGDIATEARREGKRFMGMRRVLRQPRVNTPYSRDIRISHREAIGSAPRSCKT